MPQSKSSRKRQTRLGFTPLPSSSPAAKDYNKQIRDRAAAVTLEDSPSKRRKLQQINIPDVRHTINVADYSAIPTPEASSIEKQREASAEVEDIDDMPVRTCARRSDKALPKKRARQPRLDFASTRDPDSFDPPITLPPSSTHPASSNKAGMFSSPAQRKTFELSSDDSDDGLPSARKLLAKSKSKRTKAGKDVQITRSSRHPEVEIDEESDEIAVKSAAPQQIADEDSESEDEDDLPVGTQQRCRQRRVGRSSSVVAVESEDDDGMPTTTSTQGRGTRKRRQSQSSFIHDSTPMLSESDDDDVIIVPKPSNKRRRQERDSEEEQDVDSEDEASETPVRPAKKSRHLSEREKEDLAEDLDFLRPSSDDDDNIRCTQSAKKSARQKALDKLKRIRSSQQRPDGREDEPQVIEDDEDDEVDEDEDGNEDEPVPQYSSRQMFRENDEDGEFIEEGDGEEELGVLEDMPIQFTRHASSKPKELFKHAVEWMISKLINPAFRSDDPLYRLAFQKLDDEVRGLAGSKFTSSAWTPVFTVALESRPRFEANPIDRKSAEHAFRDKCDACNRSGHPPTWEVRFRERPYDLKTLEEFTEQDDDEDDSNSTSSSTSSSQPATHKDEQPEWDSEGREIVPANTVFYLGKFCHANAEKAHTLRHWRLHLYDFVKATMKSQGYFEPEELAKRNDWNTSKRQKYANKIVDRMQKEGTLKQLWSEFKGNIDVARSSKQGRYAVDSP